MEDLFEETRELAQQLVNTVLETEKIYKDLILQRDNSKSYTLKHLLNTELCAYLSLTEATEKYMRLLLEKISENEENRHKFFKDAIKDMEEVKNMESIKNNERVLQISKIIVNSYNAQLTLDNIWIMRANMVLKSYPNIISRNFKDWYEFAKMLGGKISDVVADAIPGISECKNIYENIRDIAELVNEFEKNATDYSEVDKSLFEIEQHIALMKEAESLFKQSIEISEKSIK